MDLKLTQRRAVVLGGSAGIGRAIATELVSEGASVAIGARDAMKVKNTATEIGAAFAGTCDVANSDSLHDFLKASRQALGGIDILIINTGGPPAGEFLAIADEQWDSAYKNLWQGTIASLRFVLPEMQTAKWGRIVLIGSSSAREPLDNMTLSNAFRPGLLGLLKSLSREVAKDGITVNAVLPGRINTDRIQALYGNKPPEEAARGIPAGRVGQPDEIGSLAAYLVSGRASYITGQAIACDGGMMRGI